MSATSTLRVAAAHIAPVFMDTQATIDKACAWIEQAGRDGIDLLVFPEVFVPGFPYWLNCYAPLAQGEANLRYLEASVTVPGPEIARVMAAARQAGVFVVLGVSEREGGTAYNTQVFIDAEGRLLGKHRKLQPTYAERYLWGQGDGSTLTVFDTPMGRIGGLACWEHTMNLARQALILQHEEIHAASWPALSTLKGFAEIFDLQVDAMCRSHAITGQCFVIVAEETVTPQAIAWMESVCGPQDFMTAGGGWSSVIHPWGIHMLVPHTGAEEKLVSAEINLQDIRRVKGIVDSSGHSSRPEILRLVVDNAPKQGLTLLHPQTETTAAGAPSQHTGSTD